MDYAAELTERLEAVYAAFSDSPRPRKLEISPYETMSCYEPLFQAPLRELSPDALFAYAGSALYTVGSLYDYKHFLPRLIELAVGRSSDVFAITIDPQGIAAHLVYGKWRTWPKDEQFALSAAFEAAWAWSCHRPRDDDFCDDWLCAAGLLGLDVSPLLDLWITPPTVNGALQLAAVLNNLPKNPRANFPRGSWDDVDDKIRSTIWTWLASNAVTEALVWAAGKVPPEYEGYLDAGFIAQSNLRLAGA